VVATVRPVSVFVSVTDDAFSVTTPTATGGAGAGFGFEHPSRESARRAAQARWDVADRPDRAGKRQPLLEGIAWLAGLPVFLICPQAQLMSSCRQP